MKRKLHAYFKHWIFFSVFVLCLASLHFKADASNLAMRTNSKESLLDRKISGTVTDSTTKEPLPGVNVRIEGTSIGIITDIDGKFTLNVPDEYEVLTFSFVGYQSQKIEISGRNQIDVTLSPDNKNIDQVTVVAFAKQKKSSVIASITTIDPKDLKVPSSNLTTALAGRMAGIISYQRSGEPGQDNAEFFVRGITTFGVKKEPLILIDGIELSASDLARMQPDDIASFSIMKDASATALYGARGANGVIYVTTKEGTEGTAKISVRFENSISRPTREIEFADPITYMKMGNEAVKTRNPLGYQLYSPGKIENTMLGTDPVLYPATDWYHSLLRKQTTTQRFNMNISGGGKIARYYISTSINNDNGLMKVDEKNNFNSNIKQKQYQLRSNMNINLTKSTKIKFTFNATMDNYRGPLDGGADIYKKIMRTNPVLFRPYYEADAANEYTKHILFGNYGTGQYLNPYADMTKGYKDYKENRILAQIELNQDLTKIAKGLSFRIIANGNQYSYFEVQRFYNPYYYQPTVNPETGELILSALNNKQVTGNVYPQQGTEYLNYNEGNKNVNVSYYAEGALQYNRKFAEKHDVSGLIVTTLRDELFGNSGSLQNSLPHRNMGVSGRFTYGYKDRYFAEYNFGYNGSERFAKNNRYGFFPAIAAGWIVSNENFFVNIKNIVSKLKLKASYGLVGNDAIGNNTDRFFYMSEINPQDPNKGATFGEYFNNSQSGYSIIRYANDQISWEKAKKTNIGIELELFQNLEIQADIYQDNRSNILMDRITLASMGLQAGVRANVGEAKSRGIDISATYNKSIGTNMWIQVMGNFTYATSEITKREEPDYSKTPWLSQVGYPINQQFGYIAERLFIDNNEVANSPEQTFGGYLAGDIKYRDINGDDRISALDKVAIGYPTTPEIVYGAGFSFGYKALDFSVFFQGLARESFWVDPWASAPFVDYNYWNETNQAVKSNQLLKVWADSYWSEENRNSYARWPRLSTTQVANNNQTNTWFMQDGSFLRLKSVEIGYSLPKKLIQKIKLAKCRVYVNGTNLLTFSKFKLWDPEMGGNGLGYPIQKVVNFGVNVDF